VDRRALAVRLGVTEVTFAGEAGRPATPIRSILDVRMTVIPHGPLRLLLPLLRRRMQQQELDNMRLIKGKLEDGN
jgi:hypothetical protein